MATEVFLLTVAGIILLFTYPVWVIARLVFTVWRARKKIYKKDFKVSSETIAPLASVLILLILYGIISIILELSSYKKFGYNFITEYMIDTIEDFKVNALINNLFPKLIPVIQYVDANVPTQDMKIKVYRDIFPVELIVFPLFFCIHLGIKIMERISRIILNGKMIKNFFMVDESKPETHRVSVLYASKYYIIPGFILMYFGLYFINYLYWPNQVNYFMAGGVANAPPFFEDFFDVYNNLEANMGGFIQNGLAAPVHNSYYLYEFLLVFVFWLGASMVIGFTNSLQQTTLDEEVVSQAKEAETKIEVPPASLNQYLKRIYLDYPLFSKERIPEKSGDREEDSEGSSQREGIDRMPILTKRDPSPLFSLEPIRGNPPILDAKHPNFQILGLNERYPDTVYQGRYQYLGDNNQHLIWKRIIKILNLDIFYITQTKVFDNLYNNRNVILSTENLSGKTSIMMAAIFHEILQKKRTVLVVVAHDSVADEFNHTMIEKFEIEPWFSSIHKLTLTSKDNVRFQQNVSDRKPDIIFITPEMIHEEILGHPKAYTRFLEDLGLICFPDLQYLEGYEFIHSSFICMRLFHLIKTIANKTRLQLKESSEIPQNVFISIGPLENALEICKSFTGKLVNLTEFSEIRDSQAPSSDKRIFGFRAKSRPDLPDPYRILPFTLAHKAISMKIKPVVLLGFRDRISAADKIRAASQLENDEITRVDFEQNVLIEEDFLKFREKEIYTAHTSELLKTPLIIVSGENDRLLNFSNIFRSIGILSQHKEVLVLGIVTNEESETNFRYLARFWKDFEEKRDDRYRIRKEKPIPKYDYDIKSLIQNHIMWLIKDNFSMEDSKTRTGLFIDSIRDSFQIPDILLSKILIDLENAGIIKKIEKREYLNNRRRISFQGYTYLSNPNDEKIYMRSKDKKETIPVKDIANGKVILEIDDFERETYYFPGTTHSINEERYKIIASNSKELLVQTNKTLIESRIHFQVSNKDRIKETILDKDGYFSHKKYAIAKIGEMNIQTFITGEYNQLKMHSGLTGFKDSLDGNRDTLEHSKRIPVELKPHKIIHRNPFSNETISIEDLDENINLKSDDYVIRQSLDLFAVFLEQKEGYESLREDSLLLLEEKVYSATELVIDNPRKHLIITACNEEIEGVAGVMIYFISRALYNSNIFEILEKDISLVNQSENSFIIESLKVLANNVHNVKEAATYGS